MFSVTPEPAVSKPAYDPQARQARADQPQSDGFAALVDSNATAAADPDRSARPEPDASRRDPRDTRGTDAPPPSKGRPQADSSAASSNNDSSTTQQDTAPFAPIDTAASGKKPAGETETESVAAKPDDKPQGADTDPAAPGATIAIPAIVAAPVAVVIAVATGQAAIPGDKASFDTKAAAPITSAAAITAPGDASAAPTAGVADSAKNGASIKTEPAIPDTTTIAPETSTPEASAATISAAATVIKSDSKTGILGKDGETTAPAKDARESKQTTDALAKPVADQAAKPQADAANTADAPAQHDKAASESDTVDTASSKHAAKATLQAEHRTDASTTQQALQSDPGVQPPTGLPQQPIQTQTANLTAIVVPTANTALAESVPVPLNGLAADIALRAAGGNSRFEIRLDPAELGRIDVRLDVDKHGNVTSHLTVERPATLDMLRRDAPQLQQALENAGLKTGDSGLQFSLRDQSSSGQNHDNESGRNSQRVVIAEEDTIPAQVAGRTYGRMLGSSSGVDIRI